MLNRNVGLVMIQDFAEGLQSLLIKVDTACEAAVVLAPQGDFLPVDFLALRKTVYVYEPRLFRLRRELAVVQRLPGSFGVNSVSTVLQRVLREQLLKASDEGLLIVCVSDASGPQIDDLAVVWITALILVGQTGNPGSSSDPRLDMLNFGRFFVGRQDWNWSYFGITAPNEVGVTPSRDDVNSDDTLITAPDGSVSELVDNDRCVVCLASGGLAHMLVLFRLSLVFAADTNQRLHSAVCRTATSQCLAVDLLAQSSCTQVLDTTDSRPGWQANRNGDMKDREVFA